MRKIINGLLYDTEKAECLGTVTGVTVYKTKYGRYFTVTVINKWLTCMDAISETTAKEIFADDIVKYIELFGAPEEA